MITISPTYVFIWEKKRTFVGLCAATWSIFMIKKTSPRLPMPDYCKTKENVNIKFVRLAFVYILLSTCQ